MIKSQFFDRSIIILTFKQNLPKLIKNASLSCKVSIDQIPPVMIRIFPLLINYMKGKTKKRTVFLRCSRMSVQFIIRIEQTQMEKFILRFAVPVTSWQIQLHSLVKSSSSWAGALPARQIFQDWLEISGHKNLFFCEFGLNT